jgi:asparagine synthase (glutamine-hydrolysing)
MRYITIINHIYKNIFKLEKSTMLSLKIGNKNFSIKKYWDIENLINSENINYSTSFDDSKNYLEKLLENSVKSQMLSDVPIGCFLSSGIDSIYLKEVLKDSVTPFTLSYNFCKNSSSDEIIRIKKYFSLKNYFSKYFEDSDILNIRNNFSKLSDTLSIDGIQFLLISEFIKKNNFKVAIAGFGADEIFNSYPSYNYIKFFNIIKNITPNILGRLFNFNNFVDFMSYINCFEISYYYK